ncbi:reverse transcriptase domain-containing protein [Tanacetum coccineum]
MESGDEHEDDNGDDNGNGNGDGGEHGNENGMGGGNGNRHPNMNVGGVVPVTRECTYQDFMNCRPLNFKGTEGVVGLTRWFEKIVTVFHISNCLQKYQVKYATCTLQNSALTWWNSHKRTVEIDVAYAMTWKALMKLMTEVYCPRNEIQKMETELWNLTVKGKYGGLIVLLGNSEVGSKRKDNKDKRKQKQSKPTKKRRRQDKSEDGKPNQSKPDQPDTRKDSQ